MKLKNVEQIDDFIAAVKNCKGSSVQLRSQYGDVFELKSEISRYIALGALLGDHGDDLELFCTNKEDEKYFLKFFAEHPDTI